jgi:hypothetical protein
MGQIYANAYATIFADRAATSEDGLYRVDEDMRPHGDHFREIEFRSPLDGTTSTILAVLVPANTVGGDITDSPFCLAGRHKSHLEKRGWVMQEEYLSRRKICFLSTELFLQCGVSSRCDCGGYNVNREWKPENLVTRFLLLQEKPGRTPYSEKSLRSEGKIGSTLSFTRSSDISWKQLVQLFTLRELTCESDTLPALSGIASQMLGSGKTQEDYLAGVWKQDPSQLLWSIKAGIRASARHSVYYAPTWSWASVTGAIEFHPSCQTYLWQILNSSTIPAGENILGPVSVGWTRIKSKVAPVTVVPEELPMMEGEEEMEERWRKGDYSRRVREGRLYCLQMSVRPTVLSVVLRRGQPARQQVRLDTAEDWKRFPVQEGRRQPNCLLLFAGICPAGQGSTGPATPVGILIRQSHTDAKLWKRIALVTSPEPWEKWKPFVTEKTLVLI